MKYTLGKVQITIERPEFKDEFKKNVLKFTDRHGVIKSKKTIYLTDTCQEDRQTPRQGRKS